MSDDNTQFDPARHLMKFKGNDYLEVKYRIMWMRSEHPDASLETELVSHTDNRAIMRARVVFATGGVATGWGSCTSGEFDNYIEKAETKAIGRALTALGYGTPVDDDSPTPDPQSRAPQRSSYAGNGNAQQASQPNAFLATPAQIARIKRIAGDLRMSPDDLNALIHQHVGTDIDNMNKRQASGMIDALEDRRAHAGSGTAGR